MRIRRIVLVPVIAAFTFAGVAVPAAVSVAGSPSATVLHGGAASPGTFYRA